MKAENLSLKQSIENRTCRVGVVGLGYVGLPLIRVFWDAGFPVLGFDIEPEKIHQLKAGRNYLRHLGENIVSEMVATEDEGRFDVTADFSRLAEADAILMCVPTPLDENNQPDLSYVENTTDTIAKTLRAGQLIVLESTTYPGTTREIVLSRLESGGLKCGKDFFLAFSPEREDPGRKDYSTKTTPKLVGGIDKPSCEIAVSLYEKGFDSVIPVSSAEIAEAAKLLENVYRAVNIAMVNELKRVFTPMGIDIWEVIDAAATKPFGFQAFYPGPGLGGHCIPIDPYYLAWKARQVGQQTQFIELAGEVNHAMPEYVVNAVKENLESRFSKQLKDSRILVLGLAYKPNVEDVRESPSFELIKLLSERGAAVDFNDPHVSETHSMRKYDFHMKSVVLTARMLQGYDCVVISTHHDAYDWQLIADNSNLIVDTRNALRNVTGSRNHIIKA